MSDTQQLEDKLTTQQTGYLARLEQAGQLPTVISDAWAKAGGADQAKLRTEEGSLLKDYVAAGAVNREKYKDVWDPFARDSLAAKQTALSYSPIADIRSELAMRAQALGVATNAATAMYNADTKKAETGLGFTENAYSRAWAKEQATAAEIQHQKDQELQQKEQADERVYQSAEKEKERAFTASENAKSRAATAAKKDPGYQLVVNKDTLGNENGLSFYDKQGKPITAYKYLSGTSEDGDVSVIEIRDLLSRSKDLGDAKIIQSIDSGLAAVRQGQLPPEKLLASLQSRYPYVFGK